MTLQQIESLFHSVQLSDYPGFIEQISELSNVIADYEGETETIWYLGEHGDYTLDALLVGAYWHLTCWHGGQDSKSYAALCAIGRVFNPGMTNGPEDESSEKDIYDTLDTVATNFYNRGESI